MSPIRVALQECVARSCVGRGARSAALTWVVGADGTARGTQRGAVVLLSSKAVSSSCAHRAECMRALQRPR